MFVKPLPDRVEARGLTFEVMTKGSGKPLLFLHGMHGVDADDPLVERLAAKHKVIVASAPGFGLTELPKHVTSVDDIVYAYLDLIETLGLDDVTLVGVSFGGWIAAELAIKGTRRFSKLVLMDAVGIKVSERDVRDVTDVFAYLNDQVPELFFADKDAGLKAFQNFAFPDFPEEVATRFARNCESLVLFAWSPHMFNPRLLSRLKRIDVPTLVLWGAEDKIVKPEYGRAYAAAIPGAKFELIANAGHYGYLEKTDDYAKKTLAFTAAPARAR